MFGTESLLEKHETGLSAVCTELIHILRKRQQDQKCNKTRVLPILLSGDCQTAFPPEFERYIAILDWKQKGYIRGFDEIYLELFGLPPERFLGLPQPSLEGRSTQDIVIQREPNHKLEFKRAKHDFVFKIERFVKKNYFRITSGFLFSIMISFNLISTEIGKNTVRFFSNFAKKEKVFIHVKRLHRDFIGRKEYLEDLYKLCFVDKTSFIPVAVLWGESGIGKSEIAYAFTHKNSRKFSFAFQINCESEKSYEKSYRKLANCLKIPISQDEIINNIVEKVHSYLEEATYSKPWLLIFDNVVENIALPQNGFGKVILTTNCKSQWTGYPCFHVTSFSEAEALKLMSNILKTRDTPARIELIRELDYFPFVLTQTAHYISETPGMTEEKYLELLRRDKSSLLSAMPQLASFPYHLQASWKIVSHHLKTKNPDALGCLQFCCYLYRRKIPVKWLEEWLKLCHPKQDRFQIKLLLNKVLKDLSDFSLINYDQNTHAITSHSLRQNIVYNSVRDNEELFVKVLHFFRELSQKIGDFEEVEWNLDAWKILSDLDRHLQWFIQTASDRIPAEDLITFHTILGNWEWIKGQYKKGEKFHQEALEHEKEVEKNQNTLRATSLKNLGKCFERQGHYQQALKVHQEALDIRIKKYGNEHIEVSHSLHNIAWVQMRIGNYKKAAEIYEKVISIRKKLLGDQHLYVGNAIHFLGVVAFEQGKYAFAKKCIEKGLIIRENSLGANHPEVGNSLHYLARIATKEGRYEKAKAMHHQVLTLRKKVFGECHPYKTHSEYFLAGVIAKEGKYTQAINMYFKVLDERKLQYGEKHPHVAATLNEIGKTFLKLYDTAAALRCHQEALMIQKKIFNESHPSIIETLCFLGQTLLQKEDYKSALEYFQTACQLSKDLLTPNHPQATDALDLLAISYRKQGDYEKALSLHCEALKSKKSYADELNPSLVSSYKYLGIVFEHLGKYFESLEYLKKALFSNKQIYGESHPATADSYNHLGWVLSKLGKYHEAKKCHLESLKIQEALLGKKHPSIIDSLRGYGWASLKLGAYRKAKKAFRKALFISLSINGENHPTTFRCQHLIALLLGKQNKLRAAIKLHEKNLKSRLSFYGEEHPYVLETKHYLGEVLGRLHAFEEGLEMLENTLKIRRKIFPETHPMIIKNINAIAEVLLEKGEYEESQNLFFEVLKIRKHLLGKDHPEVMNVLYSLAKSCYGEGKLSQARNYNSEALKIAINSLGPRHPTTRKVKALNKKLNGYSYFFGPCVFQDIPLVPLQ